jgi:single-stranded-DNA-specific exonuclease
MADLEGLLRKYRSVVPEMMEAVFGGRRILVVTHIDADGLCGGSVVFSALMRRGANATLRTVPELDPKTIADLASQRYDFYIFVDLASSLISDIEAALGGRYLVIDHHEIPEADMGNGAVVNAWAFGYDGGREACSSAMAYFFATAMDPANGDLSPLAVVGALADRQDSGPGRSLSGLNRTALEAAQRRGLVAVSNDLMFTGRETRPVHEAIALTSTPFLRGLTGSKDAVLATLHQSGLELKDGGAWRTISSLSEDEKKKLIEVVAGALGAEKGATEALAGLFGEVYTFLFEDPFTPLRDAREFGTLLNSCGRMGVPSVGISICLGDRSAALGEAMKTLSDYRSGINRALDAVTSDPNRIQQHGRLVLVRGEGVVDEKLLGPVISILTGSPAYRDKVVVGSASSRGSDLKISSRVGDLFGGSVDLGIIMREAAEQAGGVGGGHAMAAGAKIPSSRAETFSKAVVAKVTG